MSGRRVGLADQLQQAGVSIVGVREVRAAGLGSSPQPPIRRVGVVSCHGFGKTSWEISRRASSSVGQGPHHSRGYPVLCMSPARQHAWRSRDTGTVAPIRGAPPERMSGLFAVGGAQLCQRRCQARTPIPTKRAGTWCSRTDFVGVPREWFAAVKRAEVETSVALPRTRAVDHAVPVVELVISPSLAGHECSRSIDASRALLRRPEVREQIEHLWSHALPIPSGFSVDEHADLPAKAARVAWRRAAPVRTWQIVDF